MLQKSTQWLVDRLIERIFPAIGSFFTASLQRMLILGHAEQHDQLEQQARLYEEQGKPHLASLIRAQAKELSLEDPMAATGKIIKSISDSAANTEFQVASIDESPKPRGRKQKSANITKQQGDSQ